MDSKEIINNDEISLKELIEKAKVVWKYLLSRWVLIFFIGILGEAAGLAYAWLTPVKYVSRLTFVVEESKGGAGGLASLAGQFGIDVGGAGGGSVFSGENILLFLKSESLVRETLLTQYSKINMTLADRYAEVMGLKKNWSIKEKIGVVDFSEIDQKDLPRKEDSLLQEIERDIIEDELIVSKPDKKASFIEVKVSMQDELLSKLFSERLVKIATDRYVDSKTKTKSANVNKLQMKADSLAALLNNRTYAAASTQQSLVDVNPAMRAAPIAAEITARDKTMAATLYAEVVKNLELSRTLLNQETPVIEMVDISPLPLEKERIGKLKSLVLGGFLGAFVSILYLIIARWFKTQL